MSKIEARGAPAKDSSDWNHAWNVVSQLAAARGTALRELGEEGSAGDPKPGSESAAIPAAPFPPIAPDQLARDIAELEPAAAGLRRAGPPARPRPARQPAAHHPPAG